MANGWALEGAVQNQIEDSVKDALATARARMPAGSGRADCEGRWRANPAGTPRSSARCPDMRGLPVWPRQAPGFFLASTGAAVRIANCADGERSKSHAIGALLAAVANLANI